MKAPARGAGAFQAIGSFLAAMGGIPGDPMDIGAADADVGKFAIAKARKFGQALVVTLPLPDQANKVGKHSGLFLSNPALGRGFDLPAK
jgi:hypothetical protein